MNSSSPSHGPGYVQLARVLQLGHKALEENARADKHIKGESKPYPQQAIDKIWKTFSRGRSEPALSVIPSSDGQSRSMLEHTNEDLSRSYRLAAQDCRRKVECLIKECKTMNLRYRDPDWDLETDFKYEKGNCLNRLDWQKFDLDEETKSGAAVDSPKAVRRVAEIFESPTFMKKIDGGDVRQGCLDDCWVMAAFTALSNVEGGLGRVCVAYDTDIGIYGFVFYRDGEWIHTIIDDKLYLKCPNWDSSSVQRDLLEQVDRENGETLYRRTYQTGSKALFFAQCRDPNETWVPLLEKAYAKVHGDYASLAGGWIGECLEDLCGGVTTEILSSDILDTDRFWNEELSAVMLHQKGKVNQKFLFGACTGVLKRSRGERNGISEGHAYVLLDARELRSGQRLVKLRNPWGAAGKGKSKGIWEGPWCDGSKEWTRDAQQELGHEFGDDAVFWMRYEDLLCTFSHLNRTRLLLDPGWRCCQRWISVAVPWLAVWRKQFSFNLTKTSPLIVVLSQLDRRYFHGLHGQYSFRLHFRLYNRESSTDIEYMARSHSNYLMDRSASAELDAVHPGNYTIYIKISAERDPSAEHVEEVIEQECFDRTENEKLARVGQAYNLAHSKARDYMDRVHDQRRRMQEGPGPQAYGQNSPRSSSDRSSWLLEGIGTDENAKGNLCSNGNTATPQSRIVFTNQEENKGATPFSANCRRPLASIHIDGLDQNTKDLPQTSEDRPDATSEVFPELGKPGSLTNHLHLCPPCSTKLPDNGFVWNPSLHGPPFHKFSLKKKQQFQGNQSYVGSVHGVCWIVTLYYETSDRSIS